MVVVVVVVVVEFVEFVVGTVSKNISGSIFTV